MMETLGVICSLLIFVALYAANLSLDEIKQLLREMKR